MPLRYSPRNVELVVIAYFLLAAARVAWAGHYALSLIDWAVPPLFVFWGMVDARQQRLWTSVVRDWLPMPFILLAYFNVDWIAGPATSAGFEQGWIALDRMLLGQFNGRGIVESLGPVLPGLLEFCYLTLYAVPPFMLGAVYLTGHRRQADRFLSTMFLGAFTAYALLPLFPSESPRQAFAGELMPRVVTVFRQINLWLLDTCDIQASVFPSGHVAVAFSCALGMLRVAPERRWLWISLLVFATLVFANTIYGRYHYAVDGLAGLAIALASYAVGVISSRRLLN